MYKWQIIFYSECKHMNQFAYFWILSMSKYVFIVFYIVSCVQHAFCHLCSLVCLVPHADKSL